MRALFVRLRASSVVLAGLVLAAPALADAPRDPPQYEQFDRETTEIADNFTKLVWDRLRVRKGIARSAAEVYCGSTVFPGAGRLPTVKELLTIVDEEPHQEYDTSFPDPIVLKAIDPLAFPDTPTDRAYWTSTPGSGGRFLAVSFTTGRTEEHDATELLHARCVR